MKAVHSSKFGGTDLCGLTNNIRHLYKHRTQKNCATILLNSFVEWVCLWGPCLWTWLSPWSLKSMQLSILPWFRFKAHHRLAGTSKLTTDPALVLDLIVLIINDEHVLYIKHGSKYTCANSFKTHRKPVKERLSTSIWLRSPERLRQLPKVT